jgi:hypothetical protein
MESVILVFAGYSDGALVGKEGDEEDDRRTTCPLPCRWRARFLMPWASVGA